MDNLDEALDWGVRLDLLAQLQAQYYGSLRDRGFDEEQAFALMRDWSANSGVLGWSTRAQANRFDASLINELAEFGTFHMHPEDDPTLASPDEPYLVLVDDLDDEQDEAA